MTNMSDITLKELEPFVIRVSISHFASQQESERKIMLLSRELCILQYLQCLFRVEIQIAANRTIQVRVAIMIYEFYCQSLR